MRTLLLTLASLPVAFAHIGSPDVFYEGNAGPYRLLVTVRQPGVIPGIADIEVRSATPEVREIRFTIHRANTPRLLPTADLAKRSKEDPQFFTGALWLMQQGANEVYVFVDGTRGKADVVVPVATFSWRTKPMQKSLGALLLVLGVLLAGAVVSITGAAAREGQLDPGEQPSASRRARARRVMSITAVVVALILWLGNNWWNTEAAGYADRLYKQPVMKASLEGADRLVLRLEPRWYFGERLDNLLPDHGHLMHLYVIRLPRMERVWHLHPGQQSEGRFEHSLPPMPAGRYRLYADIVTSNGFPRTMTADLDLPAIPGTQLTGDDSAGAGPPLDSADPNRIVAELPDGTRMVWERDRSPLAANRTTLFRFLVEDRDGRPVGDLEPYMGMAAHAAFVRTGGGVFAHVHPSGSVPMASLMVAQRQAPGTMDPAMHAGMQMPETARSEVSLPYGFPQPGDYRIFVQVKRRGNVETGVFDARVR